MYVYMIIDTKNVKVQRRHGHGHGQMVNTSNFVFFRSEFKANCHCKVSLQKKLCSKCCLSSPRHTKGTGNNKLLEEPCDGIVSHPGRGGGYIPSILNHTFQRKHIYSK